MSHRSATSAKAITRQARRVRVRCVVCRAQAEATVLHVDAFGIATYQWFRLPDGWWALMPVMPDCGLHVRCPACLEDMREP
jgi:hypothetical protein